ncbi:MAG TPA: preprotein translocase subunit SecE [Candidatus Sulfomarinibacteraceae bacterium]|nr:preprotein translocase subunit SecE [Candidatus Sulfomarinibacteraceae bacterium]
MANSKRAKQSSENPLVRYFRETRGELRKVTWPTRDEAWRLTLIVLAVTAAMAVFLGVVLDTTFSNAVEFLVRQVIGV